VAVHAVGVALVLVQLARLLAVVLRRVADPVAPVGLAAVGIGQPEERWAEPVASDGEFLALGVEQPITWAVRPGGGRVRKVRLLRVVLQERAVALE
jgi:hypothetical protein